MSSAEPPNPEQTSGFHSSSKSKGKRNARKTDKALSRALKTIHATTTSRSVNEISDEDEAEWPWTTLADSSICSQPVVFTTDKNYFFSIVGAAVRIYSVATGKVVSTLSSSSIGSSASRIATGEAHSDVITSAFLNPENPFQLLTASLDGSIKVWNFLDAVLLHTIHVGNPISHMCAHDKFKGHVFIAVPTKFKKTFGSSYLDGGNTMIYRVSLTPKEDATSQSPKSSEIVRIGKTKAAVSMSISPSGFWLVVIAGHKAYVSLTSSLESGFTKFVSPEKLTCLAFHPVDDYFATGDEIGQIRLWYCLNNQLTFSSATGEKRAQTTTMHWHAHAVSALAFSKNGAYLLSGGEESVLVIWQLQSGRKEYIPRLGSPISTIAVRAANGDNEEYLIGLADGSYMFVGSDSLSVNRIISRMRLDPKGTTRPPHTPVPLAAHKRTSTLILPASHPSSLQLYSPSTSALSELEVSPSNRVSRRDEKEIEASRVDLVSVSRSGIWMATIDARENEEDFSSDVNLKIWQWNSSTWILNTRIDRPHASKKVVAIDFSPHVEGGDDEMLMTVGMDGKVKTWCIRSIGAKAGVVEEFWINRSILSFRLEIPSDACWSPDGSLLAVCFDSQIALYEPYSSVLLDSVTTMEVRDAFTVRFVGKSGRYLLACGRYDAVLWDLIVRTVCWRFHSSSEIMHALPHPMEDRIVLIIQPYVEGSAPRISKILLFDPTSSKPTNIRTLPFRFRSVDWNALDEGGQSVIGITHSWNIVLCGNEIKVSAGIQEAAREIGNTASGVPKRTLFQDIFGKSAFADTAVDPISGSSAVAPSKSATKDGLGILNAFDVPAYLAPPVDTLYSSLMKNFLARSQERESEEPEPSEHSDADNMDVDEPARNLERGRIIGDQEVDSLVGLFQKQLGNRVAQGTVTNEVVNGVHRVQVNGTSRRQSMAQSQTSTPRAPQISDAQISKSQHLISSDASISSPSTSVTIGKKRKKSIS